MGFRYLSKAFFLLVAHLEKTVLIIYNNKNNTKKENKYEINYC